MTVTTSQKWHRERKQISHRNSSIPKKNTRHISCRKLEHTPSKNVSLNTTEIFRQTDTEKVVLKTVSEQ